MYIDFFLYKRLTQRKSFIFGGNDMWKKLSVKELFEYSGGMKREGFFNFQWLINWFK